MKHAEKCAGKIEANIRKIAYSGYTDIQGSKIITEITAIIQTAIDDEKAELKGDCDKLEMALRKLLKSTGHCLVSTKTAITIDDLIPQVLEVAQDLSLVGRCEAQSQQIADLTAEVERLRGFVRRSHIYFSGSKIPGEPRIESADLAKDAYKLLETAGKSGK